jgi:hypothetical protein
MVDQFLHDLAIGDLSRDHRLNQRIMKFKGDDQVRDIFGIDFNIGHHDADVFLLL